MESQKNMNKKTIVAVLVLVILAGIVAFFANNKGGVGQKAQVLNNVSVSACGTLSATNTLYTLTQDISNISSNCFIITADNVVFDGTNHTLSAAPAVSWTVKGIDATGRDNVRIKNLNVTGFTGNAVHFANTHNSFIENVHGNSNTGNAINLQESTYNEIFNSGGSANGYAIRLSGSAHNNIHDNITNGNEYGIYVEPWTSYSDYVTITNNTANNNTGDKSGIYLDVVRFAHLEGNTTNFNNNAGIYAEDATNSTCEYINNTANSNTYAGLLLETSVGDTVTGNQLSQNTYYGIVLRNGSHDNVLTSNTINGSGIDDEGISFQNANDNTLLNNTINGAEWGLAFSGTGNVITGGAINLSTQRAINLKSYSTGNSFNNISIADTASTGHDIYFGYAGLNNTTLTDMNIGRYSFGTYNSIVKFKKNPHGEINFTAPISGSGTNLNQDVVIGNNSAVISTTQTGLNTTANIILNNIPNGANYRVIRNDILCPTTTCSNLDVSSNGVATFSVTGAGSYAIAWDMIVNPNAPSISITSPVGPEGMTVSGSTKFTALATATLSSIKLYIDNVLVKTCNNKATCTYTWNVNSQQVANGAHILKAVGTNSLSISTTVTKTVVKGDIIPPTAPTNLTASNTTPTGTTLSWTASTDNIGVTGYNVYKNSVLQTTVTGTTTNITGLTSATTYAFSVKAKDAANNLSASSNTVSVTTLTISDITPPVISSVTATSITSSSATVTWTTNEASSSQVSYGTTTAYGGTATGASNVTSHSVSLSGLSSSMLYHYRVTSVDASSNSASSNDFTFTTTATSGNPPVVSITAPANNAQIRTGSGIYASATDSDGIAGVQFKLDGVNIGQEDILSPYLIALPTTTEGPHTLTAVARDTLGNSATSAVVNVTVDNTSPVLSNITAVNITSTGATITWTTNEPATSQVNCSTSTFTPLCASSPALVTSHSIPLTGLIPATQYYYRILSADAAGNTVGSANIPPGYGTFTTTN